MTFENPGSEVEVVKVTGPVPQDTDKKAHHGKGGKAGFTNPWPSCVVPTSADLSKYLKTHSWGNTWLTRGKVTTSLPVVTPKFLKGHEQSAELRATWLGHACFLTEFPSGLRVIFDPVFTERCSPLSFVGPKRFTKMPCKIADIPIIDAVVISHNHYDHLSHPTITEIHKRHPNVHFFVPLGNKEWFKGCGIKNVTEMDWWEDVDFTIPLSQERTPDSSKPFTIKGRISCLPAQHSTGRTLFNTDQTLWASFSVASTSSSGIKSSVYFGGDTGYRSIPDPEAPPNPDPSPQYAHLPVNPSFAQIGNLRGPFTLGLLPIGAYDPRFISSHIHASPWDAVEIFKATKCEAALGMHWGTWIMGQEDVDEPPRLLKEAMEGSKLPATGMFDVCDIGESRMFGDSKSG